MLPHTDGLPKGTHNIAWNFETDGPEVKTMWRQERGEPLVRPPSTYPKWSQGATIKKDLIEIDRII